MDFESVFHPCFIRGKRILLSVARRNLFHHGVRRGGRRRQIAQQNPPQPARHDHAAIRLGPHVGPAADADVVALPDDLLAVHRDDAVGITALTVLEDDKHFFPIYAALSFYQVTLPEKAKQLLHKLDNILTNKEMQQLNSLALFHQQSHADIARTFLISRKLIRDNASKEPSNAQDILSHTLVHLKLTLLSLLAAMLVAIPLGIFLYRFPSISKPVLYFTGLLQTIPSIALLALMIPFLGIGVLPAIVALFLYALLPILRNTVIGFISVDPQLKKVATAIGLSNAQKLRLIELPLAMPMILTGIRTAAVINVGTATLAAFIGAGGLGEFIVTGLALNNTHLILQGAIPSALLAILMEFGFELLELTLISPHLRQGVFK